jgi:DNA-binding NarL/FixJ family response regulator
VNAEQAAPLRIALADDQALVRFGLRALLNSLEGLEVVLEADDGQRLLDQLVEVPVDVVLTDIRMPGMDGIELLRRMRAAGYATPVILLTTFDDSELLLRAVEAGAHSC